MRITFVNPGLENQSIEILSSVLKEHGHQTRLVVDPRLFDTEALQSRRLQGLLDNSERIVEEVLRSDPDLLGFSIFTMHFQWALRLARLIRKRRPIPVIMGGIHPSTLPALVIEKEEVDIVCVGEGEMALLELAEAMERGKERTDIRNLWFKKAGGIIRNPLRPLLQDLDGLPLPDKALFKEQGALDPYEYNLMAGRGCPFHCTFCGNNVWKKIYRKKGRYLRMRSVENVIQEALWAKRQFSPGVISFYADVFTTDRPWLTEFCRQYGERVGIPFFALSHPRFMNKDIAALLKEAGCLEVTMGVESAVQKTRRELLQRPETDAEISSAVQACKEVHLSVSLDQIVNLPGETEEDMVATLRFYNRLRPDSLNVYTLQYLPGTQLTETARKQGVLNSEKVREIHQGTASSSIVVGVGGEDSFDPARRLSLLRSLLTILPILPGRLVDLLIERGWYRLPVRVPMGIFALLKVITKLRVHRGYVYWGILRDTLKGTIRTIQWKIGARRRAAGTAPRAHRTLLLVTPFFSPNVGGVETRQNDLIRSLARRGHRVVVLTYQPITTGGKAPWHEKSDRLEIWRMPWPGGDLFHRLLSKPVLESLYVLPGLLLMALLYMSIRGKEIDSVHTPGLHAAMVGRLIEAFWSKPWVVSTHTIYGIRAGTRMAKWLSAILRRADHIITLSDPSRREMVDIGLDPRKVHTELTWVDQERFSPQNKRLCRLKLGIPSDAFLVLFVGRLLAIKGIAQMIEVARSMSDSQFLFVGLGPEDRALVRAARRLPNLLFAGKVSQEELPHYYNAADVFVMPSVYREGLGRVAVEALSCGLPTIVSDRCAMAEILGNEVIAKVPPEPTEIGEAIRRLKASPILRKAMSERARNAAERLFGESNVEGLLNAYGWPR